MIDDSNPNLGLYDMAVDLPADAPKGLHKAMNSHICNKGGGGQSQTTYSGIDPEFKPYLERVLSDVTGRYESEVAKGPDAIVAKMDPAQTEALAEQERLGREAIAGTGIYDTSREAQRMLQKAQGQQLAGQAGMLGSARAQRARSAAMADMAYDLAKDRQQVAQAGVGALGEAGSARQQYQQTRLDAPHTSAERYFGYLSGAPQTSRTEQSGGRGK